MEEDDGSERASRSKETTVTLCFFFFCFFFFLNPIYNRNMSLWLLLHNGLTVQTVRTSSWLISRQFYRLLANIFGFWKEPHRHVCPRGF